MDARVDNWGESVARETLEHGGRVLDMYGRLLEHAECVSIYLEECARTEIGEEELHVIEHNKLRREYTMG